MWWMTRFEKCWGIYAEKVWLENSLSLLRLFSSQTLSRINTPAFLKPSHSSHLSASEDGTECSETSAYKLQTPGNYPEESTQYLEHGGSLKSSIQIITTAFSFKIVTWSATSVPVPINQLHVFVHCKENVNMFHQPPILIDQMANNLAVVAAVQLFARHANPQDTGAAIQSVVRRVR